MRELRFRVWDSTPGYELMTATVSLADIEKGFNVSGKNRTVMQWTGLTDRNGVEIYEGDLLKIRQIQRPFEVVWQEDAAHFRAKRLDSDTGYGFSVLDIVEYEVIGNIYEHGHLLENESKE